MIRSLSQVVANNVSVLNQVRNSSSNVRRLNGKVAIVTASTEGIGYAIVERLALEGAKVVLSSRKEANVKSALEKLKSKGLNNVEGMVCHVGNEQHRKELFQFANSKFGGLDIFISNAAVNPAVGPILEADDKVWSKVFEVNVMNAWQLAKLALPELKKRGGGNILFVSSVAAYEPLSPLGVYSVSKTALLGLTKTIAKEVAADNVRVNCVAPGIIATKFSSAIVESDSATEEALRFVPMNRLGRPDEIAASVAFLVSDDASYITGETLVAAGGQNCHL